MVAIIEIVIIGFIILVIIAASIVAVHERMKISKENKEIKRTRPITSKDKKNASNK